MVNISYIDLSFKDYYTVWCLQKHLFKKIIECKKHYKKKKNYILFVEHDHTYTIGSNYNYHDVFLSNFYLECIDAKLFIVDRGGGITYHGPGQLVVYLIIDLESIYLKDVKKYLFLLESIVIDLLHIYGLIGVRYKNYTGVWIKIKDFLYKKISFIGVKLNKWVTMHGLSININTNINYYKKINPCNMNSCIVTSMNDQLGYNIDINNVKINFQSLFKQYV